VSDRATGGFIPAGSLPDDLLHGGCDYIIPASSAVVRARNAALLKALNDDNIEETT
jgi:hypothetical protein